MIGIMIKNMERVGSFEVVIMLTDENGTRTWKWDMILKVGKSNAIIYTSKTCN